MEKVSSLIFSLIDIRIFRSHIYVSEAFAGYCAKLQSKPRNSRPSSNLTTPEPPKDSPTFPGINVILGIFRFDSNFQNVKHLLFSECVCKLYYASYMSVCRNGGVCEGNVFGSHM